MADTRDKTMTNTFWAPSAHLQATYIDEMQSLTLHATHSHFQALKWERLVPMLMGTMPQQIWPIPGSGQAPMVEPQQLEGKLAKTYCVIS